MKWHAAGQKPSPDRRSEAESVYKSQPVEEKPRKPKRKLSKLGVFLVVVLILVVAGVGCSVLDRGGTSSSANKTLSWPTSGMATRLPTPDSTRGEVTSNSDDHFDASVYDYDKGKYGSYEQACKDAGFTVDAKDTSSSSWRAYDKDGYRLELHYWDWDDPELGIDLYAPVPNDPISWPQAGLAGEIPAPASLTGEITSDSSSSFSAYVTNVSPDDYASYVSSCLGAGFSNDYSRHDDSFSGGNGSGVKLYVDYIGFNTMNVRASQDPNATNAANTNSTNGAGNSNNASQNAAPASTASNQDSQAAGANEAATDANATENASANNAAAANTSGDGNAASDGSTVTPSFKATMDSYEAFFDKYVAFVKKYDDEGHPASMLADYSDMMTQYADYMQKLSAIDEDTLSDADLAYYIEVNARIQQKLLTVS